jgi:hypothetical protein
VDLPVRHGLAYPLFKRIVTDPSLDNYAPLGLTFTADANAMPPPCVIGNISCVNRAAAKYYLVSLIVTSDGSVFCGDEESPDQPVQLVNTTVSALAKFIKAHRNFTNDKLSFCERDGRRMFESYFLRRIGALVVQFQIIDPDAVASRDNWWPYTLDCKLAEYRRYTSTDAR